MKFTLEELIGCPAKNKSQKRKRDDGEAEAVKKGAATIEEAPASLEGIIEGVPEPPAIDLEVASRLKGRKLLRLPR